MCKRIRTTEKTLRPLNVGPTQLLLWQPSEGNSGRRYNGWVEIQKKLPLELLCIFIRNNKQTTDLVEGLWYFIRKENAKEFYDTKGIMDPATFDTVN